MTAEALRWYRSKVDWWMVPLLCLPPVAAVVSCVALLWSGKTAELPWGIASVVFVVALYGGLLFPLRYGMDEEHLVVRYGLVRNRIPLREISEVRPTRNPLSSPALSLDRLRVQFGAGFFQGVMISPANRDAFLAELARRAGLRREGDRLFRA